MPFNDKQSLELLADCILLKLTEEFENKEMSGNLRKSIRVTKTGDEINIHIPARVYNMLIFQRTGIIVHDRGNISYASKLDIQGSSYIFYPNGTRKGSHWVRNNDHKDYVERSIREGILMWQSLMIGARVQNVRFNY